jgi:tetratricopeptide (TPR) repeat protein
VIHRDIKPSNVLVTLQDGVPVVKVIDFGVAKAMAQKLTENTLFTGYGQMIGTPAYMSPEQAEMSSLDIDTRSDVYSLGVLLYELLTGTTPLDGTRLREAGYAEMQRLIREEAAPWPSKRLSALGDSATVLASNRGLDVKRLTKLLTGDLSQIVMKALEKDRSRRYDTPGHLVEDIERYLRHDAILARPPSVSYQLKKFVRRNRTAVAAAVVTTAALLAGTGVSVWQAVRATRAAAADKRSREIAEKREAETKAVLEFVENRVFSAARPEGDKGGLGHDVTLRKAIEAALPYISTSFPDQPLVEARLRMAVSLCYQALDEHHLALEQLETARALFDRHLDPDHDYTLVAMNNLANTYHKLGRNTEALRLHQKTLALFKAKLGPTHRLTLVCMTNLANDYVGLERLDEARQHYEETLKLKRSVLGSDDPDTYYDINGLAFVYACMGRHKDALPLRQEALKLCQANFGPTEPHTLHAMMTVAECLGDNGRFAEAIELGEKTLDLQKNKLGPTNSETLESMDNLADNYFDAHRHDDAINMREKARALRIAKQGADDLRTIQTISQLAESYAAVGRKDDALKLREETLRVRRIKLGDNHHLTLRAMDRLVASYWSVGRRDDAMKLREESLKLRRIKPGTDHPDTQTDMLKLATIYSLVHREDDALRLRREALDLQTNRLGRDNPETLLTMWGVAESLSSLHRGAEAVPLVDECVRLATGKVVHQNLLEGIIFLRLRHFQKAKDAAGCRQTAEMWEKLNRTDVDSLYIASCMRAVTASVVKQDSRTPAADADRLAKEDADLAIAWLKRAVAAGYRNVIKLTVDTDLEAVRRRDDFKELLGGLKPLPAKKP